ncbi:MAG TPA: hypothetical protein VFS38_01815, partial [Actinomycetota bacterium]|nr:hypothetical protein [Actinomycetota bacterium]
GAFFAERYRGEAGVSTINPARAWAEGHNAFELGWGAIEVGAAAHGELRSDGDSYDLTLELDVTEGGRPLWSRRWQHRYPRRLQ